MTSHYQLMTSLLKKRRKQLIAKNRSRLICLLETATAQSVQHSHQRYRESMVVRVFRQTLSNVNLQDQQVRVLEHSLLRVSPLNLRGMQTIISARDYLVEE